MRDSKIVRLGEIRDLLAEWEKVRTKILSSTVTSFYAQTEDEAGHQSVYWGGRYKEEPHEALAAMLKVLAARAMVEDLPAMQVKQL